MNHRLLRSPLSSLSFGLAVALFASTASAQGQDPAPAPAPAAPEPAPAAAPASDAPSGASGAPEGSAASASVQAGVVKDQAATTPGKKKDEESKLPFRGSTLLFDQSVTTQTAHLETSPQQSYVPLYEWWFSFRPKWYFTDKLSYTLRLDFYKEFTNANETTYYRENVFGDIWNTLGYKTPLAEEGKLKNTSVGISGLIKLPTSKESQANGTYVTAGLGGSVKQTIPINGEEAKLFPEAHVALSAQYQHAFTKATTATGLDQQVYRQDTEGRSFLSDQVRGSMLPNHQVLAFIDTGLGITDKLSLTLDMIFINSWKYKPTSNVAIPTNTGTTAVPRNGDATSFTQSTWFIASLDYDLMDEVSLGLGYYNLQNALSADGQHRGILSGDNVWWSPDARVFFDITANLDKIYEAASGRKKAAEAKKSASTQPSSNEPKAQTKLRTQNLL